MADFNLGFDEGIIIESNNVVWIRGESIHLQTLTLTNKNLFLVYQKSNGLFSKPTTEVIRRPLSDIKVINGQPMVDQVKNYGYSTCLQIQFLQGRDFFAFNEAAKQTTAKWHNALWRALVGTDAPVKQKANPFSGIGSGFVGLTNNLKNTADSAKQFVLSTEKKIAGQAGSSHENTKEHIPPNRKTKVNEDVACCQASPSQGAANFCTNCGEKLDQGVKFCPRCGNAVNVSVFTSNIPVNPEIRQQKFAGAVLKCPNCGAVISQTTAVCPECGHHITGQKAVSSVQEFSDKLSLLESRRKNAGLGQMLGLTVDPVDNQKLSLIRSFPIPNTIDDIQEFMLLAIANIDVSLSKNTLNNRYLSKVKSAETSTTMPRTISNAWVSKMEQAYKKALVSFPNDPAFLYVKQLYVDKMTELKMKLDN